MIANERRAWALNVGMAGFLCLVLTLGVSRSSHADPVTIRIGLSGAGEEQLWLLTAKPDLVAKNYGKAYTLESTLFQSSDKRAQAFEAGAIDLADGGATGVIFAAAEGVSAKIIASICRVSSKGFSPPYYAKADSPIKSVADMKGKIVGINGFSTTGQLWLDTALQKDGLSDSDVTITPVAFPAMQEALASGKIDVGEFPQPFAVLAEKQMPVRKIFDANYGMPFDQELDVLIAKDAFLKKNATAVRALLQDLQSATHYYLDHPQEARQILIDTKMVRTTPDVYLNMQDNYRDPDMKVDADSLVKMQDLMVKAGFQQKTADVRSMVDMSYLPQ